MKLIHVLLTANLLLIGCGGGSGDPENMPNDGSGNVNVEQETATPPEDTFLPRNDVRNIDEFYAYRRDSEYADVISDCMRIPIWTDGCTLDTLPFIAQVNADVTVEDVMDRLVVSHDWMGERFEQFLNDAPNFMISMFGSVTSVVIGSTVRTSYYTTATGAITMDPSLLWQTVEEKQTIAVGEGSGSGLGDGLIFWNRHTWVIDSKIAITHYNLEDYSTRTMADVEFFFSAVMYHELAHASDFLPPTELHRLDSSLNTHAALWEVRDSRLSDSLTNDFPLFSEILHDIGQVKYQNSDATEAQKSMDANFIGAEMANDGASRMYSYSTEREDFANLFETVMMKNYFNADHYVAVMTAPADISNYSCDDLTLSWGTRNRLSDPLVNARARMAMSLILGSNNSAQVNAWLATLLVEVDDMTPGVDWCTNRDEKLSRVAVAEGSNRSLKKSREAEMTALEIEARQQRAYH